MVNANDFAQYMTVMCTDIQKGKLVGLGYLCKFCSASCRCCCMNFDNCGCMTGEVLVFKLFFSVGSSKDSFLMCTLEIPQKFAAQVLALNLLSFLLLSFLLKLSFSQTMSFSCIFGFSFYFHLIENDAKSLSSLLAWLL